MKYLVLALATFWVMPMSLQAGNSPVVVELYTSQGCSSCPPADEMMQVLSDRDDVIPLSLHVDYWDYIGWKDEFAHSGNAERQRAYASIAGRRSVYTPEMIVNGVSDIVGAKPMKLATAIEKHKSEPKLVELSVEQNGETVLISAQAIQSGLDTMDVIMLRYQPERVARITRGENAGKTIRYMNVTQDWQVLGQWDGETPLEVQVDAPGPHPVVVLIQTKDQGPIRAAARLH